MNAGLDHVVETLRALLAGIPDLEGAEVFLRARSLFQLECQDGRVKTPTTFDRAGVGLRLQSKNRTALAYGQQFEMAGLRDLISRCERNLDQAPESTTKLLPMSYDGPTETNQFVDQTFAMIPIEEKSQRLLNLEANVCKAGALVTRAQGVRYVDLYAKEWLWTLGSKKVLCNEKTLGMVASVAVAEKGDECQLAYAQDLQTHYYNLNWGEVAKESAQLASRFMGAGTVDPGRYNVVLSNRVMVDVLGLLSHALSGEAVERGASFLSQSLGKSMFAKNLHVFDDPLRSKTYGMCLWDCKGTPTRNTSFVEDGIVKSFAHNHRTAKVAHTTSNGHAWRRSERVEPEIGFYNLSIEPGNKDFVDLTREITRGIVVYKITGVQAGGVLAGDFSFKGFGMWIENGVEQRPVGEFLLRGNLKSLLSNIISIGRDIHGDSSFNAPSVAFENVEVIGS